jgi:DNA mismatch repair protein MutS
VWFWWTLSFRSASSNDNDELDLTLTAREKGDATKVPFCGVPHHSAKQYWIRLLQRGFSVALCDQIEDPEFAKGLVERDIVRIYTPGTLDELEGLSPDTRSYLLSIFEEPSTRITTCLLCDVSTGLLSLHSPSSRDELKSLIARHQPKEILCRSFFKSTIEKVLEEIFGSDSWPTISFFSEESLREHTQLTNRVDEIFGSHKATALNIQKNASLKLNLQGLVCYLDNLKVKLGNFRSVSIPSFEKNLRIDGSAMIPVKTAFRKRFNRLWKISVHCFCGLGLQKVGGYPLTPSSQAASSLCSISALKSKATTAECHRLHG